VIKSGIYKVVTSGSVALRNNPTLIMFSDETLRKKGNKSYPCACNEGTGYSGDLAPQILNYMG
jgi:hypothetical protein